MKKKNLLVLTTCFVGLCAYLFMVFYGEAEKTAIRQLNDEQHIHAKQAAHGIEDFFTTWTGILNSFSKMDAIISVDAGGKRYMTLFYEAHHEQIRSITRVDERGRILHTVPYSLSRGSDLSGQKHMREILREHKPVVSDVFKTVQGFYAVALHVPVFKGAIFKGTIAIVIDFENLAKRYLEVIKIGKTGYAWVVSREGTILYSPVPGFTGKSAFDAYRDFSSIITMTREMLQGHEGTAVYIFDKIGDRTVSPVKKYAVYMPIHIANSFWSVVVASSEDEVLSSLASFRNRLILVIGMILLGGVLFSMLGIRAWGIVAEEKNRKRSEEELRAGKKQLSLIYDGVYDIVFVVRVEPEDRFRFITVNRRFLEATGLQENQIVGRVVEEVIPEPSSILVLQKYKEAVRSGRPIQWEEVTTYLSGEKTAEVSISPVFDENGICTQLIGTAHDITERKRAENALRYSEQKFMKAFQATPDAIVISRAADGHLMEVNEMFLRMTGYSREEVSNKSAMDLNLWVNPTERERYVAGLREQGRVRDLEAQFRTRTGAILDSLVSGESILLSDEPCVLSIIRDVSEQRKIGHELEKHRLHLEEMVSERTAELKAKIAEIERMNNLFVHRELRMIELKEKIKGLESGNQ